MLSGWINYKSLVSDVDGNSSHFNKIAILVPSYKEDDVINEVAKRLKSLSYPSDHFEVFVIADSMKSATIEELRHVVQVIEVEFARSTKSKSINAALSSINEQYDIAVISDADNILDAAFLQIINSAYNKGLLAMQGQRIAKNTNTRIAVLDGASEAINNHIFRRGNNGLGFSSAIIGSGMAFDFLLFKELMSQNKAIGGFDKVLQLALIERGVKIYYLENAITFDEKVQDVRAFKNQRRRWISSQYKYFALNFAKGWRLLFRGNFDYFNLAVVCGILPPRSMVLGLLILILLLVLLLPQFSLLGFLPWLIISALYLLALVFSIPNMILHRSFLNSLLQLPAAFLNILLAALNIKDADQSFIHTKHTSSEINNHFRKKGE